MSKEIVTEENLEDVFIDNVNKCLDYLGMSKSDFATKLKWSLSKYSKTFGTNPNTRRTLTFADSYMVAGILGFGIEDLMKTDFDPVKTRPDNKRMSIKTTKRLSHCLDNAITFRRDDDKIERTMHVDFPKAIRVALNMFTEEYTVEGHKNMVHSRVIRAEGKEDLNLVAYKPYVFVKYNGLDSKTNDDLIFGYWFDVNNRYMALAICYLPNRDKFSNYGVRKRNYYKELVSAKGDDCSEVIFDNFAENFGAGEIYTKLYSFDSSDLSDETLVKDLQMVFGIYKDLLIKSANEIEETYWDAFISYSEHFSDEDIKKRRNAIAHGLTQAFTRRDNFSKIKQQVIEEAGYHCEICGIGKTFEDKNGKQFFEVSHLIPVSRCLPEWNADTKSNLICVCPTCNRSLSYANSGIREEKLVEMYYKRKEKLSKEGINISLSDLLKMNDL